MIVMGRERGIGVTAWAAEANESSEFFLKGLLILKTNDRSARTPFPWVTLV